MIAVEGREGALILIKVSCAPATKLGNVVGKISYTICAPNTEISERLMGLEDFLNSINIMKTLMFQSVFQLLADWTNKPSAKEPDYPDWAGLDLHGRLRPDCACANAAVFSRPPPPALARRLRIRATAHESVVSGGRGAGRRRTKGFRRIWAVSGGLRGGGVRSLVTAVELAAHGADSVPRGRGLRPRGRGLLPMEPGLAVHADALRLS